MTYKILLAAGLTGAAASSECKRFDEIFADGEDICNNLFGNAFVYTEDDNDAFTMWFFGENPNDDVAERLFPNVTSSFCHLEYLHKDGPPSPEPDDMTECLPWKESACCDHTTVPSAQALNNLYGEGYAWDRCGPMSQACERFFVQEACMYECSPHIGLYRRYPVIDPTTGEEVFDPNNEDHNNWEVSQMPIKASYCNSWFDACRADRFCGEGDYFECANIYEESLPVVEEKVLSDGAKAGISVAVIVAVGLAVALCLVYRRERQGKPVFAPLGSVKPDEAELATNANVSHA